MDQELKHDLWLKKRSECYITSSSLPNLMKGGRGKNVEWGEVAKNVLYEGKYKIRTGVEIAEKDFFQFKWGHENEPMAIEWLKTNMIDEIKSCSTDFEEISFNQPFEKFGDSPDFYAYNEDGSIKAVGEIKCPVDQTKIEKLLDQDCIDESDENYWQFIGHLIGCPEADELWWLIYDAYADEGHLIKMKRVDHFFNIKKCKARIQDGIYVIDQCLESNSNKISNVELILQERK